jgi:hypothetical protein
MAELHVIPLDMAEAFSEAVLAYSNWTPSIPEFRVRLGGDSFTMSAICDLVDKYPDQLPDEVFAVLVGHSRPASRDRSKSPTDDHCAAVPNLPPIRVHCGLPWAVWWM